MNLTNCKTIFWTVLLTLALLSAIMAIRLFPQAMPLLQVNVSLSRDQALDAAEALQTLHFAELLSTRAVARFDHDTNLQNYIEIEGGGASAFSSMLGQRFVAPYYWTVRRFSESQEEELSVRFTPDGHNYGFTLKVPENAPGAALDEGAARSLAETGARNLLGDALWAAYAPQGASLITRPGGRVDHSFVYEHQSERRGEARFRLKLAVAGARLVEVAPYAFVPQAFAQRFAQLRAGNEWIAQAATIVAAVLFGMGGVLGGWLWLTRRGGGLEWRPAMIAAGVVGVLLAGAVLSNIPQSWFGYATTDSARNFLLRQGAMALGAGVGATLMLGLIFAVADGLSRQAFAQHPRVFNVWSHRAGASPQVIGRTLGGYAWMSFELLLLVTFYLVARTQFGWWLPTESLADPNILSAWRPALVPISQALMAGTTEEALFRAVSLSGAALIGQRLGWRRSSIAVVLVLQALCFASAHASYPGLPSYSRVVELFLPALVWGLIFLRYGLVPCILMHFTFDLTLMSVPLFVATDARLWLDRVLVVVAALFPLLMIARARFKQGYFAELPTALRYGEPAAVAPTVTPRDGSGAIQLTPASEFVVPPQPPWWLGRTPLSLVAVLGALALLLWPAPQVSTPVFTMDHEGAVRRAEGLLAERGVRLDGDWKRLAIVRPAGAGGSRAVSFVWREVGPLALEGLLGSTLLPQHWQVLFKLVSGPVEERSEIWEVALTGRGEVLAVEHHLPEGRAGAKLNRNQAQALVQSFMADQPALANRPWELASVEGNERPGRRDWVFKWDDKRELNVKGGTSRVTVTVRGDEPVAWQDVFVPEAWIREQQQAESAKTPFKVAAGIAGAALVLLALSVALRQVALGTLHWQQGLTWATLFFVSAMAEYALTFDRRAGSFSVAQDWNTQFVASVALAAAVSLLGAVLLGLLAIRLHRQVRPNKADVARDLLCGLGLALLINGVGSIAQHLVPSHSPHMPGVGAWDSVQPLLTTAFRGLVGICTALAVVALTRSALHFCQTRLRLVSLASLVVVFGLSAALAAETLVSGVAQGLPVLLSALILWALVRRGELWVAFSMFALSPLATLPSLPSMPIANAGTHAALSCAIAVGASWLALRYGRSPSPPIAPY